MVDPAAAIFTHFHMLVDFCFRQWLYFQYAGAVRALSLPHHVSWGERKTQASLDSASAKGRRRDLTLQLVWKREDTFPQGSLHVGSTT
jgi:hypothetical protein